jgi:xanthine dehydrogenase YagS FAD-binding subunit
MRAFDLVLPATLEEALALLPAERGPGHARPIAGGQDLVGELQEHLDYPDTLVDLKGVAGLGEIELDAAGGATLGALVTIAALEEHAELARRFPLLAEAAASVGSPQIRSQGTLGGNLCQRPRCWYFRSEQARCLKKGGSECFSYAGMNKYNAILGGGPSYIVHPSDLAPALVALDATVELARLDRRSGAPPRIATRALALGEFFTLPASSDPTRENVLAPDELVTRVVVPARPAAAGWRGTWLKFRERESYDWALAAVAASVRVASGRVAEARLVLGGVAPIPWRVPAAEAALVGKPLDQASIAAAREAALAGAEPLEHNGYKVPLTKALITRALGALV